MKATSSLRWKIIAWFFVNLLLIGVALFVFLRVQFQVGIHSLLAGATGARLDAIAQPLADELRRQPQAQWPALLDRATADWRARGLRAALFRNDGTPLGGDFSELPAQVAQVLENYDNRRRGEVTAPMRHHENQHPPMRPFDSMRPPRPHGEGDFDGRRGPPPGHDGERPPRPGEDRGGPAAPGASPAAPASLEKFMLVTGNPHRYWAGVHLDAALAWTPAAAPLPVTLVISSDSLRGGGLFFDYVPWLWLAAGVIGFSMLLWLPMVHRLTRALAQLTHNAEAIAQGRFEPPPEIARQDEIGRLNRAHRHMAARLDGFVTGQRRFLGDTAHELLSPLARLEVALSILEQHAVNGDRAYTERALGEVRNISTLVHDLLSFTKAGLRVQSAQLGPVALLPLAHEVAAREAPESPCFFCIPEEFHVQADRDLLVRALANLLRNAVRYAGAAGAIQIRAVDDAGVILLSVVDQGPGVPPDALDRLFDPFFRPDTARTQESGGTGLGLAIVKSCIEACGGTVTARNVVPTGFQVDILLPRAKALALADRPAVAASS